MLTELTRVRLVYTAALSGDIASLPRLMTRIKQERASAEGIMILADLGLSCAADTWICQATEGRGMLVAMDALGYDAFHIGALDPLYRRPDLVQQIRQVIVTPLAAGPWWATVSRGGLSVILANATQLPTESVDLVVGLATTAEAQLQASGDAAKRRLLLQHGVQSVAGGTLPYTPHIGRIDMVLTPDAPYIEIVDHQQLTVPDDLPPDPTLAGVIEFVESEARQAERKRQS